MNLKITDNVFAILTIPIFVYLVYGQTINFGYCIDDQYYLWLLIDEGSTWKEYLHSLQQRFWGEQYRPTVLLTIIVESVLFGESPRIHHQFNLIYYSLLCLIVFVTTKKVFKSSYKHYGWVAATIAISFLLHSSHANVVSSIKNREIILSLSFGLLALLSWLKYLDTKKIVHAVFCILLFAIGVESKLDILPFLLIIPLIGFFYNTLIPQVKIKVYALSVEK